MRASFFSSGLHRTTLSPAPSDFSADRPHRAKRQRLGMVWDPERGFIPGDADGKPILKLELEAPPKNEAERILERLENVRKFQVDGLRNRVSLPGGVC